MYDLLLEKGMLSVVGNCMVRVLRRFMMIESRKLEAKGRARGTWNEGQYMDALRCKRMDTMDWRLGKVKLHPSRYGGDRTKSPKSTWPRAQSREYSVPFPTAV